MSNPVAIVTGASRGIGRGIALELGRAGHDVAVNFVRSREAAEEVANKIREMGQQAVCVQADVGVATDRERLVSETNDTLGRLDVLINNAGITSPGRKDLLEATEDGWDTVFGTNLKGPFFLAQHCAREMIRQIESQSIPKGTIINISSISAYAVSANRADYCMAKAAMQMMTWLFADRLAEEGVRVYEICPGIIESDMTAPVKEKYDQAIASGLTPIRRWGTPEDVGKAAAALVSDTFSFSTGERFNVDGGFHIRRL